MGGHLWTSKLLITCRVIKVIPLYICFRVSYLSEISFHLQQCSIHIKFVRMACEFLLWDVALFMQWTCEIDCKCTSQHINNRKYINSYTINNKCRQTIVCKCHIISVAALEGRCDVRDSSYKFHLSHSIFVCTWEVRFLMKHGWKRWKTLLSGNSSKYSIQTLTGLSFLITSFL